jgi:drug/metabolite transporter (DMT)-like permease
LYVLPLYVLQRGLNYVGEQVQPRYLLPLIVVFAGIAFLGLAAGEKQLSPVQLWVSLFGIVIANSLALYVNTKRYVSGLDNGNGFSLETNVEWWWSIPIGPMAMWVIGSLGFALAIYGGYRASHVSPQAVPAIPQKKTAASAKV